uniref:Secreted protein n=1 Tax=Triticum urartu TaxID=4572 RepID=A0A8R7PVR8_TRIUA
MYIFSICCCLMLIQRRGCSRGADLNGSVYAAVDWMHNCSTLQTRTMSGSHDLEWSSLNKPKPH